LSSFAPRQSAFLSNWRRDKTHAGNGQLGYPVIEALVAASARSEDQGNTFRTAVEEFCQESLAGGNSLLCVP
jgi:hypothetical protein